MHWLYFIYQYTWQIISFQMMPPPRSFDDLDGKERGQKKTDDLRAMTTLGPRTLPSSIIRLCIVPYVPSEVRSVQSGLCSPYAMPK